MFDAWREYLDYLGTDYSKVADSQWSVLAQTRDDLFVKLLAAIADERGFQFDNVDLKKGGYHPNAMIDSEEAGRGIISNALEVLSGRAAIRVQVDGAAVDEPETTP